MNKEIEEIINFINDNDEYIIILNDNILSNEDGIINIVNAIKSNNTIYGLILYKNNTENKETYEHILFDVLKQNKTFNTLKYNNLTDNNIDSLVDLLLNNNSIKHLNITTNENINYDNLIKLSHAIKKHNILRNITLNVNINEECSSSNIEEYILISSLKKQLYLEKITLYNGYNFSDETSKLFAKILYKLKYIKYIKINNIEFYNSHNFNIILKSLCNKDYLKYIEISNDSSFDNKYLIMLINTNKKLKYLNISYNDIYINDELLIDAIINSNINTFYYDNLFYKDKIIPLNIIEQFICNSKISNLKLNIDNYDKNDIDNFLNDISLNNNLLYIKIYSEKKLNNNDLLFDLNNLITIINNNKLVSLYISCNFNSSYYKQLFECLKCNNSIHNLVLQFYISKKYSDKFIDSFCDLLLNNTTLKSIEFINNSNYLNEEDQQNKKFNIEQINKIKNALNKNNIIKLKWLDFNSFNQN